MRYEFWPFHSRRTPSCPPARIKRLRFYQRLPIREIAARWQTDPAVLHHESARARQEFKAALRDVVSFHHPGAVVDLEQECVNLQALLA